MKKEFIKFDHKIIRIKKKKYLKKHKIKKKIVFFNFIFHLQIGTIKKSLILLI